MASDSDIMNAVAAAQFLGVHVETLRKLARKNEIPSFKIGRDWRFRREALLHWADQQRPIGGDPNRDRTVLIVDDEESICRAMAQNLERLGYRALKATSGARGLELVESGSPDLILLDLMMPLMNGPQFLEELRKSHADLPVVIVTGFPESNLMRQAMRHAPVLLLEKPAEPDLLERTLNTVLGEKASVAVKR